MPASEPAGDSGLYEGFIRRVQRIILVLGLTGAVGFSFYRGILFAAAFLIGAAISFTSFWGWQRVVDALVPIRASAAARFSSCDCSFWLVWPAL